MFATRNPAFAYRQVGIETEVPGASPHRLVHLLYDAAIASVRATREHLAQGRSTDKGASLTRAIRIVDEGLKASLDPARGGDLAARLAALYDYMVCRLLQANAEGDPAALEEVERLLATLRDAWSAIDPDAPARAAPPARRTLAGGLVAA